MTKSVQGVALSDMVPPHEAPLEHDAARIAAIVENAEKRIADYRARREGHVPQDLVVSAERVIAAMRGMIAKGRLMNEDMDLLDEGLSGLGFRYAEPAWPI